MADRFPLACSPVVFDAHAHTLLTHSGHRFQALLDGTAEPRDLGERYFIDCVQRHADYHSHKCLEAEAWRKLIERREFERLNPPPAPGRTWVRPHELQPGVILTADPYRPRLLTRGLGVEYRGVPHNQYREYRLAPQFPWRRADDGWFRQVSNLTTGALEELPMPPTPTHRRANTWAEVRDPWGLDLPDRQRAAEAVDEPPRELLYVWWDAPDDDMLLTDADTAETFHLPPNQIAEQAVWRVFPHTPMRVQCWADRPVWVCGPT